MGALGLIQLVIGEIAWEATPQGGRPPGVNTLKAEHHIMGVGPREGSNGDSH